MVAVFLNDGKGDFAYDYEILVEPGPMGLCAGDLDNDGDNDIASSGDYYGGGLGQISLLANDGGGKLSLRTQLDIFSWPYRLACGDVDGDGDLDIFASLSVGSRISVIRNLGGDSLGSELSYPVGNYPYAIAVADFDSDGDLDIATANLGSDNVTVLMYDNAELTSITPDSAARNYDLWVTISGSSTHFSDASSTEIWLSHASSILHADSINIINSSLLAAHLNVSNSAPLGKWDVWVNDQIDPPLVLSDSFTIFAVCGDIDGDASINIADAVYMIEYIFGGGPRPVDITGGDVDCGGDMNIGDAVYLINYIFSGGAPPCAGCK